MHMHPGSQNLPRRLNVDSWDQALLTWPWKKPGQRSSGLTHTGEREQLRHPQAWRQAFSSKGRFKTQDVPKFLDYRSL